MLIKILTFILKFLNGELKYIFIHILYKFLNVTFLDKEFFIYLFFLNNII